MVLDRRLAGILLHPTSLPGHYGIGDLGTAAYRLLDWMESAGLAYWQVLPLGPTSYGDSPYQCLSACAGNPLLISPNLLRHDGLLELEEILPPDFPPDRVDYGWVIDWKRGLFRRAHERFRQGGFRELEQRMDAFLARPHVQTWIEDFALFMAIKDSQEGRSWNEWPEGLRRREKTALDQARADLKDRIDYHRFVQFLFFDQWDRLRASAHGRGIRIIGDAPIYVSYDSADTWAHQDLFQLDADGNPTHVAGVPPDYFSETGQLWGNPLYRWGRMAEDGYAWWADRLRSIFAQVDVVRLDHFRGFMGYWSVPFGEPTAVNGQWVKGPGAHFFTELEKQLGPLPIIAEDLGEITTDVTEVRRQFGYPGMKVMQFAFTVAGMDPLIADPGNPFQLHRHTPDMVVYTGTHDNDTTVGWWNESSTLQERVCMQVYLATDGNTPHWDLIRACFMSVGHTAIIPAQDFLGLGSYARMNFPGRPSGNWTWRLRENDLNEGLARRVREMTLLYERCLNPPPEVAGAQPKRPEY